MSIPSPAPVNLWSGDLRPLSPLRDMLSLTRLLMGTFGEDIAMESRGAGQLVRWLRRFPSMGWMWLGFDAWLDGTAYGIVWDGGEGVVANASIAPIMPSRRTWVLSNVAVEPALRGRGLGRAVVERALEFAWRSGAHRVLLQVWRSNTTAVGLYRSLGFRTVSAVDRWVADADGGTAWQEAEAGWGDLLASEAARMAQIVRLMVPDEGRPVRPSARTAFEMSWTDRWARWHGRAYLPHASVRRGLRESGRLVAGFAAVPASDAAIRVTLGMSPMVAERAAAAVAAELRRVTADSGCRLTLDLPAVSVEVGGALAATEWSPADTLWQMALDRT